MRRANFRTLTLAVNAADPSHLSAPSSPSAPAAGGSVIWEDYRREPHATARRTGAGPWSAYRLAEAAEGEETLYATLTTPRVNPHFAHMTDTRNPQMRPWYALGAQAIYADASVDTTGAATPMQKEAQTPVLVGA